MAPLLGGCFYQTVAAIKQDEALRVGHVKLEERPVEPPPKKRGLLDIYEEKKAWPTLPPADVSVDMLRLELH